MPRCGLKTIAFVAMHAVVGALLSTAAHAQDYPTKPITLIVPW